MLKFLKVSITLLSITLLAASCATFDAGNPASPAAGTYTDTQKKLLAAAASFEGSTSENLYAAGRTYRLDCSGGMLAVYYSAGINLEKCYEGYEGNGVKRLYSCLREEKLILNTDLPQPGDLIFWDNTWDRNEDGKFNDYFTHIGMVVDTAPDGTVTYIHHNYRRGFIYEKMNLLRPDDRKLNSPMRMKGSPPAPNGQYLASHLVRVFGRAWKLPAPYWR